MLHTERETRQLWSPRHLQAYRNEAQSINFTYHRMGYKVLDLTYGLLFIHDETHCLRVLW